MFIRGVEVVQQVPHYVVGVKGRKPLLLPTPDLDATLRELWWWGQASPDTHLHNILAETTSAIRLRLLRRAVRATQAAAPIHVTASIVPTTASLLLLPHLITSTTANLATVLPPSTHGVIHMGALGLEGKRVEGTWSGSSTHVNEGGGCWKEGQECPCTLPKPCGHCWVSPPSPSPVVYVLCLVRC